MYNNVVGIDLGKLNMLILNSTLHDSILMGLFKLHPVKFKLGIS